MLQVLCLRLCNRLTEYLELVFYGILYKFCSLHQALSDEVVELHLSHFTRTTEGIYSSNIFPKSSITLIIDFTSFRKEFAHSIAGYDVLCLVTGLDLSPETHHLPSKLHSALKLSVRFTASPSLLMVALFRSCV